MEGVCFVATREDLHALVDQLLESDLRAARQLVEAWCAQRDPVLKALMAAKEDDEPSTPEEDQEGWKNYQRGIGTTWEEVKKGLAGGPGE